MFAKIVENRQDTGEVIIIDNRVFSECVEQQLKTIREEAAKQILEIAPEYKQRNASLGLLTQQETDVIKTHIQNIRNQSNSLESQINSIMWDGQESTRSAACDAVQSIFWS
jgi:23S rRNA pseudoU1915 N3-methylase RlmH